MSKDGFESIDVGEALSAEDSTRARRAIARINYMALDRPDLAVVARTMSQHMSNPREGVIPVIKRVLRYLKRYPRCFVTVPRLAEGTSWSIQSWTDSDWATDPRTRKSCSGGYLMVNGFCIAHWSKTQANVALSSGEAELNASVKAISELIGLKVLLSEVSRGAASLSLHVDASACKGILLRQGAGKIKHLSVKQLWTQGAVQSHGIDVVKVPRCDNLADPLTHVVAHVSLHSAVQAMGYTFPSGPPLRSVDVCSAGLGAEGGC
jgi:hypothetical protein